MLKLRVRSEKYRAHVRSFPCLACEGPASDAHHLRFAQDRGIGLKVSDEFCVPLCRKCHTDNHKYGDELIWWYLIGVDPLPWAHKTWKEWKDDDKGVGSTGLPEG